MPSRTTPYDFKSVRGYPDSLKLFRIEASSAWQVRYFTGQKYLRKSTKCQDLPGATAFAKQFFDSIKISERLDINLNQNTFAACAKSLMNRQESLVSRGERDSRIIAEDKKKLEKDLLPWFGKSSIDNISTDMIDDYIDDISRKRKLTPSTLNKHVVVIRKVFNEARKKGYVKNLPIINPIKQKDNPRSFFNDKEYSMLWREARKLSKLGMKIRGVPFDEEICDLIVFHVNVFVRISDLKLLKHHQIQVIDDNIEKMLVISPIRSKTVNRDSISMEIAVDIYRRMLIRHKEQGFGRVEDYVFFPQFQNRAYALQTMRRQFEFILNKTALKKDARGRDRTLYSLRHTALMFRLLKGEGVDIFMLAKNALTSVDQLQRFYLSNAETRMRAKNLQSFRTEKG